MHMSDFSAAVVDALARRLDAIERCAERLDVTIKSLNAESSASTPTDIEEIAGTIATAVVSQRDKFVFGAYNYEWQLVVEYLDDDRLQEIVKHEVAKILSSEWLSPARR